MAKWKVESTNVLGMLLRNVLFGSQGAVDIINQLTVESPGLPALIYYVFYHQNAGWPHSSLGSLPDITIALVWLVCQESKTNILPPVLQEP